QDGGHGGAHVLAPAEHVVLRGPGLRDHPGGDRGVGGGGGGIARSRRCGGRGLRRGDGGGDRSGGLGGGVNDFDGGSEDHGSTPSCGLIVAGCRLSLVICHWSFVIRHLRRELGGVCGEWFGVGRSRPGAP